jgi:multiple sugar transport system ATP-binding protein
MALLTAASIGVRTLRWPLTTMDSHGGAVSRLELRGLSKLYADDRWAVRDVDLDIDHGALVVIAGPSGCGKTTLLRMVAGLEEPTAGDVIIDGIVVNDVRTSERNLALTSQGYSLYPHMTVAENVAFPLTVERLHACDVERRVGEIARVLQIDDVLDRRPRELSGGQQQRTAMARALVRHPRLLLLDEPMSNLDAKLRLQTGFVIAAIQRRLDLTTLMVTHDQREAMAMGDRLVVMCDGRIIQSGRPIDVHDAPENIFVAQFVGTPPMNVVRAVVIGTAGTLVLRIGSHDVPLDPHVVQRDGSIGRLVDQAVGLGFRADALRRDPDGPLDLDVLSTTVTAHEQFVHLDIDAPRIAHRFDSVHVVDERTSTVVMSARRGDTMSFWQPCRVALDTTRLHFFDLATGNRIT